VSDSVSQSGEHNDSQPTSVLPLGRSSAAGGKDAGPQDGTEHSGPGRKHGNTGNHDNNGISAASLASAARRHRPTAEQDRDAPRQRRDVATSRSGSSGTTPRTTIEEPRFPPGTVLAQRYRITHQIGRGGMGEVYCAEDLELEQLVAIKVLPAAWEKDAARLERLRSEVRLARSVTHPNVCRVYDIGEAEGRRFVSMELIEGEDLDALLRRIGHLPVNRATEIGIQICHGLAAIHENGVLHRDLKPANLMLDTRGCVRIADFGLASMVEKATEHGMVQGTPAYMAPEQFGAQEVSIQSDIYALGLILHKLYTGKPAFGGKSAMELFRQRVEAPPPPPSALISDIPPGIDAIIVRCLAPEPRERPASARAIASALMEHATPVQAAALVVAVASAGLDGATLVASVGGAAALRVAEAHEQMLAELCEHHGGTRVSGSNTPLAMFDHPGDAVQYALAYQRSMQTLSQRESVALGIRVGIHLGVRPRGGRDSGPGPARIEADAAVRDIAACLSKLAEPGQILITRSAFDLARQIPVPGVDKLQWLAHGSYEMDGVEEPLELCEVGVEGLAPLAPPRESERARRRLVQAVIAGWRPAPRMELPRRPFWRMEKKLGEGGFGEVWLAAHAKTGERRVFKFCYDADKLRALQREITLFRLLKETLGDRDDIVRILDWSFEEAPYFIESAYTAGGNLMDWALDQGGLDAIARETRLEIVAQVATALAAAHSVGVLHKDVKPGNVLMTGDGSGRVRAQLGDFGIGAITEKERLAEAGITAMGLTMDARTNLAATPDGTRLYMAPELLEGKPATVQADIYALGVMLYQLVVGDDTRALAPGWERDIDDELLRADIAAAVDGAPHRRLGSAAQLAERLRTLDERRQEADVLRREREEAEQARAALAQARRRRKLLAIAAAVLMLFAGTVTIQSLRIAREARAAAVAGQTAQQVSGFLVDLFEVADPYASPNRDVPAREILNRGKDKIDQLAAEPEVQATLMHVMGVVYGNIGLYQESAALLEDAVEKRRQLHGDGHVAVAESLHELASTLEHQQRFAAAEREARAALALRRALLGSAHLDTADSMEVVAGTLVGLGRYDEARPLIEEVIATRRQLLGHAHPELAHALRGMGTLHLMAGDNQEAARWYQEALRMYRQLPGDHQLEIAGTQYYIGQTHVRRDALSAAEPLFQESLAISRRLLGDEHPKVAATMLELARLYQRAGNSDEAEPLFHELLALYRKSMGDESLAVAMTLGELAFLARTRGNCAEADALSRQFMDISRKAFAGDHDLTATALANRAYLLASWGDPAGALPLYRDALEMYLRLHGDSDPFTAVLMASLADVHVARGELDQAERLLTQASEHLRQHPSPEAWLAPYVDSVRGAHLGKAGDAASAERLLLSAYESMRELHGPYRYYTMLAAERLIAFHESQGRSREADTYGSLPANPRCTSPP
jgi:serine/threonine protein kinase